MNAAAVANYGPSTDVAVQELAVQRNHRKQHSYDLEADAKNSDDKLVNDAAFNDAQDAAAAELVKVHDEIKSLPRIDVKNGAGPFFASLGKRMKSILTPRLLLCFLIGQLLSFCITTTSVVTTELGMNNWSLPATQTFFVYVALSLIYIPITLYKYGITGYGQMLKIDGWKYFILGTVDVFGNFLTVFGFRYTNLLSCLLLGAWSTPVSMVVTFFLLKARYHWTQLLGVLICIGGLGVLITSDLRTGKDWGDTEKWKGDLFILGGATCYGLSNGFEEYLVRGRPHYEVVGALGLMGLIINGVLTGAYEHASVYGSDWTSRNVGLLFAYITAMCVLYTLAPLLFRFASAPFYNLSLLTSDFFSLCFGLFLYDYSPYFLYFIAYPMVVVGLLVFFLSKPPEGHAPINVVSRGKQAAKEEARGKKTVVGDPKGGLGSIY